MTDVQSDIDWGEDDELFVAIETEKFIRGFRWSAAEEAEFVRQWKEEHHDDQNI